MIKLRFKTRGDRLSPLWLVWSVQCTCIHVLVINVRTNVTNIIYMYLSDLCIHVHVHVHVHVYVHVQVCTISDRVCMQPRMHAYHYKVDYIIITSLLMTSLRTRVEFLSSTETI